MGGNLRTWRKLTRTQARAQDRTRDPICPTSNKIKIDLNKLCVWILTFYQIKVEHAWLLQIRKYVLFMHPHMLLLEEKAHAGWINDQLSEK